MFKCEFSIKSDLSYLPWLRKLVVAASEKYGKSRSLGIKTALVITEAIDNAVIHAHHRNKKKPIAISISTKPGESILEVYDVGEGFEWPIHAELPGLYSCRGRGIAIINRLCASVDYKNVKNMNRLKVVVKK